MKNEKLTEKEKAAINAAKEEGTIFVKDLLQEILPLIKDFFIGDFRASDTAINLAFPNGQNFKLIIEGN